MHLNVGISNKEQFKVLKSMGIRHFFCGIRDFRNHRPNYDRFNFPAEDLLSLEHEDVELTLLLNDYIYSLKDLDKILHFLRKSRIKRVVLASLFLIQKLANDFHVTLSSINPVFNRETALFFNSFGVSKFIVPQHLSPDEVDYYDMDLEVFYKGINNCLFIDGLCGYHEIMEANYKPPCNYHKFPKTMDPNQELYSFLDRGVKCIKVGTRGFNLNNVLKCVNYLNKLIYDYQNNQKYDYNGECNGT